MSHARAIRQQVAEFLGRSEERVAVVLCADGKYGVTLNGVLIDSLQWNPEQFEQCVEFCRNFARTSGPGSAQESDDDGHDASSPHRTKFTPPPPHLSPPRGAGAA